MTRDGYPFPSRVFLCIIFSAGVDFVVTRRYTWVIETTARNTDMNTETLTQGNYTATIRLVDGSWWTVIPAYQGQMVPGFRVMEYNHRAQAERYAKRFFAAVA